MTDRVIIGPDIPADMDMTPSELFEMGVRYELGHGTDRDPVKAAEYYAKASELGNAAAQCSLGEMYMMGKGVGRDSEKGVRLFFQSAGNGSGKAMFNIAMLYLLGPVGTGIDKDVTKAEEWLLKAAERNVTSAFVELGMMYINGEGVEQDIAKGGGWLLRAAENGDALSQFKVGYMYEEGAGFEKDESKAFEWYRRSAENGIPDGMFKYASMLSSGNVERDEMKAVEWYTHAAMSGFVPAMFNLGVMRYTNAEYGEAYKWFEKGAFNGDADCQFYLGRLYIEGNGVRRDIAKGIKWLKLSASKGNTMAQEIIDRVEKDQN